MSNNAASNVIPMREFDRPAPSQQAAQFERLLKECQDLALERLSRSVAGMLDKVEDALWGLANQRMDREVRDLYIDVKDLALAAAQAHRVAVPRRLPRPSSTPARAATSKPKEDFSQFDLGSLELGLVNDDDLEETLKVNDMAAKLRRYCEEELAALDQRVGVLVGDANLQGEGNPFSPQAICNAFKQTCRDLESNLKVRMILHKLFDDHVLDDIRSIYKDLNTLLVERSILPKIRYGVARHSRGRPDRPAPARCAWQCRCRRVGTGGRLCRAPTRAQPAPASKTCSPCCRTCVAMNLGRPATAVRGAACGAGIAGDRRCTGQASRERACPALALRGGCGHRRRGRCQRRCDRARSALRGACRRSAGGGAFRCRAFRRSSAGGPASALGGPVRVLQGAELLSSLTRIQHGDVSVVAGGDLPLAATLVQPGTTNVLRELKSTSLGERHGADGQR